MSIGAVPYDLHEIRHLLSIGSVFLDCDLYLPVCRILWFKVLAREQRRRTHLLKPLQHIEFRGRILVVHLNRAQAEIASNALVGRQQ